MNTMDKLYGTTCIVLLLAAGFWFGMAVRTMIATAEAAPQQQWPSYRCYTAGRIFNDGWICKPEVAR